MDKTQNRNAKNTADRDVQEFYLLLCAHKAKNIPRKSLRPELAYRWKSENVEGKPYTMMKDFIICLSREMAGGRQPQHQDLTILRAGLVVVLR